MDKLFIIKLGGNIIDDDEALSQFLLLFSKIEGKKILVHGGGKLATKLAEQLDIPQKMVDGRRVTDAETLRIITMIYAGSVNKNIVAKLQQFHCNAIGLSGADAGLIRAKQRGVDRIDYGFVGDVENINAEMFSLLLEAALTPVMAPVTHNGEGQLLNTNADTIAQEIATALSNSYRVVLVYCFEKAGVMRDLNDENSVIGEINPVMFEEFKKNKIISEGMLPKMQNAMAALQAGVEKVVIGKAGELTSLINGTSGTTIQHE